MKKCDWKLKKLILDRKYLLQQIKNQVNLDLGLQMFAIKSKLKV